MKSNNFLKATCFFGALVSSWAFAGNGTHGGGTWVCRNANDSVRWVKLVDLFEAKNRYGLTLDIFQAKPIEQQLQAISLKVRSINPEIIDDYDTVMQKSVKDHFVISKDIAVERSNDATFEITPAKELCIGGKIDYEQVATYTSDGSIIVAENLYSRFTLVEKSALFVHEAIYKIYRDLRGDENSDEARKAVGYLFSNLPISKYPKKFFGIEPSKFANLVLSQIPVVSDSWITSYGINAISAGQFMANYKGLTEASPDDWYYDEQEKVVPKVTVVPDPAHHSIALQILWLGKQHTVHVQYKFDCPNPESPFQEPQLECNASFGDKLTIDPGMNGSIVDNGRSSLGTSNGPSLTLKSNGVTSQLFNLSPEAQR